MAQINFSDDLNRPVDEEGNIIPPDPPIIKIRRKNYSESFGYWADVEWYNHLYVEYTENSPSVGARLIVYSTFNAAEATGAFNGYIRLVVEISTDNFRNVLVTEYYLGRHVGSGSGVDAYFMPGGILDCYARENYNKSITIQLKYQTTAGGFITLPVTGQEYQVRLTAQTSTNEGSTWYTVGSPVIYKSFAPGYVEITPPDHVYLNGVNAFSAQISAGYISDISASVKSGNTSAYVQNMPVRNESYPYINTGENTQFLYWFPQISIIPGTSYDGWTYTITLTLKAIDPGDPNYIINVGKTVITGTVEYLAEDDNSVFTASVEISDPSGLYDRYGYLLRNTDATVLCKAIVSARYGATITVAHRAFNASTSTNSGYGWGYSSVYSGKEPKTVELEQQIPATGTRATTGIKAFGFTVSAYYSSSFSPLAASELTASILDYAVPSFPDLSIHRCNADGTANDNGDHCKIEWSVSIVPIDNQNSKNLVIDHPAGKESIALTSYGQAGTLIVAADTEVSYDIVFTLSDDLNTITRTLRLSTAGVIMDWLFGGKGVAFGQVAGQESAVEISPVWALLVEKLLLSGDDLGVWMSEMLARMKAVEQYISNMGSTDQFEVSFYNDAELLDRQWVLSGEDAEEPEIIPEREATATIVYSFAGWALTEGATVANPNALLNITAPREIYAAFSQATRYYSVLYYSMGTLLEKVDNIQYRGNASYSGSTPTSEDGTFAGWSPSGLKIVESEEAQAQFFRDEEIADSWDEILAACKDGSYKSKYALGMYKPLDLGTEGVVNMRVHAMQKDYVSTGKRRVPITWIADQALTTSHRMNPGIVKNTHQVVYDTWKLNEDETEYRRYTSLLSASVYVAAVLQATATAAGAGTYKIGFRKATNTSNTDSTTLVVNVNGTEVYNGTPSRSYYSTEYVEIPVSAGDSIEIEVRQFDNAWHHNIHVYFDWSSVTGGVTNASYTIGTRTATITDSYDEGTGAMGGWNKSEMREYLNNTILPLIPENVRNGIKEVRKITGSIISNTDVSSKYVTAQNEETVDKLCIPSYQELFGNTTHEYEGIDFNILPARRQRKKAGGSSNVAYFLRTTRPDYISSFEAVNTGGSSTLNQASDAYGVVIEFCT